MKLQFLSVAFVSSSILGLAWGCSSASEDCQVLRTCAAAAGTGGEGTSGNGGTTGKGGKGGGGGGTSTAGDSGSAGEATSGGGGEPGGAGAGGDGGSEPCDGACGGDTPVCDVATETCVECLGPFDCDPSLICDTGSNTCVECIGNEDCIDPATSKCDGGVCVGCGASEDCSHIDGKTVCDTDASECVECIGTDYSTCGEDLGTPFVCDSQTRTCTTNKEHSAGLCVPCVSDANCALGSLCVLETFGDADEPVGYFCFWKQGDTENGAPTDCFTGGKPYAGVTLDAVSVDGVTADICSLRGSTCVARADHDNKDCKSGGVGDNSLCGFAPPEDAICDQVGVSTNYICTMRCSADRDCPSPATCNTGAGTPYCEL